MAISVGSEVRLTKTGIPMKVIAIDTDNDIARCVWIDGNKKCEDDFPLASLELIPPPSKSPLAGIKVGIIQPPGARGK